MGGEGHQTDHEEEEENGRRDRYGTRFGAEVFHGGEPAWSGVRQRIKYGAAVDKTESLLRNVTF